MLERADASEVSFIVAGDLYTHREMVAVNAEDEAVCAWLFAAQPGDVLDTMHGEPVRCVSKRDLVRWLAVCS